MTPERRTLLFKLLRLAGSDSEPEALSAMREIKLTIQKESMNWNQFVEMCEKPAAQESSSRTGFGNSRSWHQSGFASDGFEQHFNNAFNRSFYRAWAGSAFWDEPDTEERKRKREAAEEAKRQAEAAQKEKDEHRSRWEERTRAVPKNSRWFRGATF